MTLTIAQVAQALARCSTAHPPEGRELTLHKDASRIADVYGEMIYFHTECVELDDIKETRREAILRWAQTA